METWRRPEGNLAAEPAANRLRYGVLSLGLALGIAVALVYLQVPLGYRLLLFLPFLVAASGFYQALYRT